MFKWTRRLYLSSASEFLEIGPLMPSENDRGHWRLYLESNEVYDQRGFSRTYFSEDNAIQEAEFWLLNWLTICQSPGYLTIGDESGRRLPPIVTLPPTWSIEGKHCTVTISPIKGVADGDEALTLAVGCYAANVAVRKGCELDCPIDACDTFPRYYFSRETAIEEMTAWMRRRGQL
jgi:hypothetical protein